MKGALLFVAQSPTIGGVVTVIETLLLEWPKSDPRPRVLVCNKGHGGLQRFRALAILGLVSLIEAPIWDPAPALYAGRYGACAAFGIRAAYRLASPFLALFAIIYFARLTRRLGVDGLISHNGGYPGGLLNRACVVGSWFAGVRNRYMIVHNLARRPPRSIALLAAVADRIVENTTTGILAVSAACAYSLFSKRFFIKMPSVVYNGISIKNVRGEKQATSHNSDFVIGFVGELHPRKGIDVLLCAMLALPRQVTLKLIGAGSSGYRATVQAQIIALGLSDRVELTGYVPDAGSQMPLFNLVVLPSVDFESFGMVLLEAMQCRLPVVVSDVGGMKEIVTHGETGLVVPAGNVEALAQAIGSLMRDRKYAVAMGEAGYRRLTEKFSADRMVTAYLALLSDRRPDTKTVPIMGQQ